MFSFKWEDANEWKQILSEWCVHTVKKSQSGRFMIHLISRQRTTDKPVPKIKS